MPRPQLELAWTPIIAQHPDRTVSGPVSYPNSQWKFIAQKKENWAQKKENWAIDRIEFNDATSLVDYEVESVKFMT